MIKKLVCIECPKGCNLSVDIEGCKITNVRGAKCPKGIVYVAAEVDNPIRILTATVLAKGLSLRLIPVRTDKPIPKKDILRAAEEARKIRITRPLKAGDTVARNFLGLGVKLVATRQVLSSEHYMRRRKMNRGIAVVVLALFVCAGVVYAADVGKKVQEGSLGKETVSTVTSTAQSVASGGVNVAKASVSDTVEAPKTAIQAVKNTANTAFSGADKAIKAITGEDR